MKYIVVGLGNFGSFLAEKLTSAGNEVMAVDSVLNRVEAIKGKVTHAITLDCTDENALDVLSLKDFDCVIVAIGEDFGASIMITALLHEKLKDTHTRLISRAMSPIHEKVLIGLKLRPEDIVHPEEQAAERLTETLSLAGAKDVYSLENGQHKVVEIKLPERYVGKRLIETDIRNKYHLNVLTVIREVHDKNLIDKIIDKFSSKDENLEHSKRRVVLDYADPNTVFIEGDIIVVFGKSNDFKTFLDD